MNIQAGRDLGHSHVQGHTVLFCFFKIKKASELFKVPVMDLIFVSHQNSDIEALLPSVTVFGDGVRLNEVVRVGP